MKKTIICIIVAISSISAAAFDISNETKISLLTFYPNNEAIYTKFGHTAIRIEDPTNNVDLTFNYGAFSFDEPGFILKFVSGKTDYFLDNSDSKTFIDNYIRRRSTIVEQELNLTNEEKQRIVNALRTNARPENRIYRYNFIYDNCATRPCTIIKKSCSAPIIWENNQSTTTYRKLIQECIGNNTWHKFGIDLLIGSNADKPIGDKNERMFLPLYVMSAIETAKIADENNRPLVKNTQVIFTAPQQEGKTPFIISPIFICTFILIFVGGLSFFDKQRQRYSRWVDSLFFSLAGIAGCIIFFLMFFSEHPLVGKNWNILWLQPLQLFFGIAIWFKSCNKILLYYQYLNIFLLISSLIVFTFHLQQLHTAFLPLIIILLLRASLFVMKYKNNQ